MIQSVGKSRDDSACVNGRSEYFRFAQAQVSSYVENKCAKQATNAGLLKLVGKHQSGKKMQTFALAMPLDVPESVSCLAM
ncbi:hypothetical protein C6W92_13675 [Roseovarius sp. A46]|uniref:hypothetical protein n=1 Tax=Roseovarius sp. A46 TaxID=2109331 RepID=UPI0010129114|nr:hypothetical protein [Roseovarius sp. A46]RXV60395.1 hypothetical protein C6W92_13675 [Roseovarius sp. A46]